MELKVLTIQNYNLSLYQVLKHTFMFYFLVLFLEHKLQTNKRTNKKTATSCDLLFLWRSQNCGKEINLVRYL